MPLTALATYAQGLFSNVVTERGSWPTAISCALLSNPLASTSKNDTVSVSVLAATTFTPSASDGDRAGLVVADRGVLAREQRAAGLTLKLRRSCWHDLDSLSSASHSFALQKALQSPKAPPESPRAGAFVTRHRASFEREKQQCNQNEPSCVICRHLSPPRRSDQLRSAIVVRNNDPPEPLRISSGASSRYGQSLRRTPTIAAAERVADALDVEFQRRSPRSGKVKTKDRPPVKAKDASVTES